MRYRARSDVTWDGTPVRRGRLIRIDERKLSLEERSRLGSLLRLGLLMPARKE